MFRKYSNPSSNGPIVPSIFSFYPAYPNPVEIGNDIRLRFSLPQAGFVEILIKSENNLIIKTLVNRTCEAGSYIVSWNLTNDNNKKVQPGVYRCFLIFNEYDCYGDIWIKG